MLHMTFTSSFFKGAVAALILFLVSDFVWHTMLLGNFYMAKIEAINGGAMTEMTFPPSILLFHIIAALVSTYFVMRTAHSFGEGAKNGAFLGLFVSAGINLVNNALLTKWDTTIVAVDMLWGIVTGLLAGMVIVWATGRAKA